MLTHKKLPFVFSVLSLAALALAACQPAPVVAQSPTSAPLATQAPTAQPPAPTQPVASEAVLNIATDAKLGKILVDGKGMTLYMFTTDGPDKSNCTGGCLKYWPPFLTQGNPKLGDGIDASLVSNVALADGSKIVVYNHMPLYYYVKDAKPGDTLGQDVQKTWYVVSPDGKIIGKDAPAAAAAPTRQAAPASGGAVVKVADNPLGKILVDDKGMTLYLFKKDTPGVSNCTGGCSKAWPPFLRTGSPVAGNGVMGKLGTVALADGSMIVTYNGMPLYYYAVDQKPGDTAGQGVGGVWFVVNP